VQSVQFTVNCRYSHFISTCIHLHNVGQSIILHLDTRNDMNTTLWYNINDIYHKKYGTKQESITIGETNQHLS
jgi:hypothetical protein